MNNLVMFSAKLLPDPEGLGSDKYEDDKTHGEAKHGTAEFIIQVEERRSIKVILAP